MEKVVIIGTGPAGLTAALYTARANLMPLVIEGLQPGGQLTTTTDVENYPGFPEPIRGADLVEKMREQAGRFGARYLPEEVISADFSGRPFGDAPSSADATLRSSSLRSTRASAGKQDRPLKVTLSNKSVIEAVAIIIATGARANYLGLESEEKLIGRGVSACATCDGAFFRNLPVAVVGGGDSAMEEALFLSRLASRVRVIHRRDKLRASKIMGDRIRANKKIDIVWNSVVDEVLDVEKNQVTGLRLRNVKTGEISELPVAGVFLAIGHKPNTEPFKGQVDMDDKGFITTSNTRTSVEGIFAAGDVQDHVYRQAITAAASGCMAALEVERYLESVGQ